MADQVADKLQADQQKALHFVASNQMFPGYYYPMFLSGEPIPMFPMEKEHVTEPGPSGSQVVSDGPEDWDSEEDDSDDSDDLNDVISESDPEEEADSFEEAEREEAEPIHNVGFVPYEMSIQERLKRFYDMYGKNKEEDKRPSPPAPDMSSIHNNLQTLTDLLNGFKQQHSEDLQNLTAKVLQKQNDTLIHQKYWSLVETNDLAMAKIRELELRVNDRDLEILENNQKMQKMEEEMKKKDEVIRKQEEKIEELKSEFFEMDIANQEFQQESEKMTEKLVEKNQEIQFLKDVDQKLQVQIQKTQLLQSMYEELAETKKSLSRQFAQSQELQKEHNEHLEDYKSQLSLETQALLKTEKNYQAAQRIVTQQKKKIEKLNQKIGCLEQEVQHFKDYADSRDRRIEELNQEIVQIMTEQEELDDRWGYEYDPQTGNRWGYLWDQ
ncbi:hypothetical protein GCK72_015855 [Caenorhabditis remanei]|uniref:Uncharacterized protein n=1 Tax=Caenorhabditis remanei TaxID=31234 RepID=A0A6A5GV95_CAERE|nr:hypothetical protein GCK72_015855 [Caenorhabditis remanei]KAF1759388.1 hypothetical protein GCK72_015855 [Caenorhabditis remanei]